MTIANVCCHFTCESSDIGITYCFRGIISNSVCMYLVTGVDYHHLHWVSGPRLLLFHHLPGRKGPQPSVQELRRRPLVGSGEYSREVICKKDQLYFIQ